jgi:hypothetical protein
VGAFFGAIVNWLLSRLLGRAPAPSRVEVQTDRAAVAETKLATVEIANAQVAQAVQAERQSDARLAAHPDELRDPSSDSRD